MNQSSLISLLAAVLLLIVGIRLIFSTVLQRNPASFGLLVCAVLWVGAQALSIELKSGLAKSIILAIQYGALAWIPPFLMGTALSFGRSKAGSIRLILLGLSLASLLATVLVFTNSQTGLLFSSISNDPLTGRELKTHGQLYPIYTIYLVLSSLLAIFIMSQRQEKRPQAESRRARLMMIAFLIPILLSYLDSLGIRLSDGSSLIPFSLLSAAIILIWGIVGSGLLTPLSMAQETVVDSLDEPVIICDFQGNILYSNLAAKKLGQAGTTLAAAYPELYLAQPGVDAPEQIRLGDTDWAVHTTIRHNDELDLVTTIIVLHNISLLAAQAQHLETMVHQRTKELGESNRALETEVERYRTIQIQLEQSVREKELLLRELHHRVKNNLQIIISLINLQSNRIIGHPEVKAICQSMKERIRAISLVHERMYRDNSTFQEQLDFGGYLTDLVCGTAALFQVRDLPPPIFRLGTEQYQVSVEICVDFGLVISELVTNAYKHAIVGGKGHLEIELTAGGDQLHLVIRDHGPGLPPGASPSPGSLGMHIVHAILAKYNVILSTGADGGAWVGFDLPISKNRLSFSSTGSVIQ